MARRTALSFFLASSLIGLSGCITVTEVKPLKDASRDHGLRYSLPATFLLVQPQSDGTATYTWVYLPDQSRTYTINQYAFLSKFTLDTTVSNGLLSKVVDNQDSTAVSAKLFDAAQQVYAAKKQAEGTANKAEATKIATAQAAVITAKVASDQAQQDLNALLALADGDPLKTPDKVFAARQKAADAQIALSSAQATLTQLNASAAADAPAGPTGTQFGPVLFRVVQTDDTVQLVAVEDQKSFASPVFTTPSAPASPAVTLTGPASAISGTAPATLTITASAAIDSTDPATTMLSRSSLPITDRPYKATVKDKTITVTFSKGLQPGNYVLYLGFTPKGGKPTALPVSFTVNG